MRKTYKIRLYRDQNNRHLHRTINLSARAYNHAIALHKRYYKLTGKHLNQFALMRHFTKLKQVPKYEWLQLIPSQALQDICQRIEKGYQLFFKSVRGEISTKNRPPNFKKSIKYKSYTLKQAGWQWVSERKLKIDGRVYRLVNDRMPFGKVKTVTIKRDKLNHLYACFSVALDRPIPDKSKTGKIAGFDFGLKTFLTGHDGQATFEMTSPLFFKQSMNRIKQLNQVLSCKQKGSKARKRAKRNLAREHRRIADRRRDWFFKTARQLTDTYDVLIFETLNIRAMQRLWGRKVSDLAFAEFVSILEYVAMIKGRVVYFIDRWFPSSKLCHGCGHVKQDLTLSDRRWRCSGCNEVNDRDGNARMNIRREGIRSLGLVDSKTRINRAIHA